MMALKRIKRIVMTLVNGTVLAFGLAAAAVLGLALVLIPGGFGILAMEAERAQRALSKAKHFLLRTNPLAKRATG